VKSKQIKVLEISSYPPPRAGWGMRIYFLKQEMEKQGHVCQVLNIGKGRFLTDRDFIPVFSGLDYVKKVFKHRLNGYLIHMHLNGDSPKGFVLTTLALLISVLTFRRPVITFHAGPVQKYFPQSQAPLLTPLYKLIFTLPRTIICNNEAVKKAIMGYGIKGEKIVPIQAFSKQYLNFEKVPLKPEVEKFFAEHDPVIASYVFFRPEFFIEDMIHAVAKLVKKYPKFGLVIMGSEMGSEDIQALIKELGIENHVILAGDQDHDSFLTILTRSKLYLRTPFKDGIASSVLEALALDVPVVACDNGSRPPSTVTYENRNVDDMAAKVEYVLEHHDEVVKNIVHPEIKDTIQDEIKVLGQ
jgi:glycosyltransferase involved in cell wall biosynthesis